MSQNTSNGSERGIKISAENYKPIVTQNHELQLANHIANARYPNLKGLAEEGIIPIESGELYKK